MGGWGLLVGLLLDLIPVSESRGYCFMNCIITPCNSQLVLRVSWSEFLCPESLASLLIDYYHTRYSSFLIPIINISFHSLALLEVPEPRICICSIKRTCSWVTAMQMQTRALCHECSTQSLCQYCFLSLGRPASAPVRQLATDLIGNSRAYFLSSFGCGLLFTEHLQTNVLRLVFHLTLCISSRE